jgi:thymidine phosphorylase
MIGADLKGILDKHLIAQGASYAALNEKAIATLASHTTSLHAKEAGFAAVNLGGLRDALQQARNGAVSVGTRYPDTAGVILRVRPGSFVDRGAELATIRGATDALRTHLETAIWTTARPHMHSLEVVG